MTCSWCCATPRADRRFVRASAHLDYECLRQKVRPRLVSYTPSMSQYLPIYSKEEVSKTSVYTISGVLWRFLGLTLLVQSSWGITSNPRVSRPWITIVDMSESTAKSFKCYVTFEQLYETEPDRPQPLPSPLPGQRMKRKWKWKWKWKNRFSISQSFCTFFIMNYYN